MGPTEKEENKNIINKPEGYQEAQKRYLKTYELPSDGMQISNTRSERRALLRRMLSDLAVAMGEAETEGAFIGCRGLFENTLNLFRAP